MKTEFPEWVPRDGDLLLWAGASPDEWFDAQCCIAATYLILRPLRLERNSEPLSDREAPGAWLEVLTKKGNVRSIFVIKNVLYWKVERCLNNCTSQDRLE